jgi:Peptidase family M1 domain
LLLLAFLAPLALADTPGEPAASHAEVLYHQLGTVALDPKRVYHVRDASLDRADMHITLLDGTIAFTEDVMGRVTGALFEGEGDILVVPPNRAERASVGLFAGTAVLEEEFNGGYFRFDDDTFLALQDNLRPARDSESFISRNGPAATMLAQPDAFRLFLTFSRNLPPAISPQPSADRFLHARLGTPRHGVIDAYYDSTAPEQITVGQLTHASSGTYFDLWTSFAVRSGKASRVSPATGATSNKSVDEELAVSHYRIRAHVIMPHQLAAEAQLEVTVKNGGQRTLVFELSRFLSLDAIEADGRPLEFIHNPSRQGTQVERRGNDAVAVIFPQLLRTGQRIHLMFRYRGDVLSEAGGGLIYVGARGSWYPHRGIAMSGFDLQFLYPAGFTLVATGKRASPDPAIAHAAGEESSRWVSERPIPLAGFNLGKYIESTAEADGVQVHTYAAAGVEHSFPRARTAPEPPPQILPPPAIPQALPSEPGPMPPPSPALNAQEVAQRALGFIQFVAPRIGPFPYSALDLSQIPGPDSQGWPGLVFLSSLAFLSPAERSAMKFAPFADLLYGELMVRHETAHQWWGDNVTWVSYRDEWIEEALSNYMALMMIENERPEGARFVLDHYREELLHKNKEGRPTSDAGPVSLGIRLTSSKFPTGYDDIAYGRGTWLIHMLRQMVSDPRQPDSPNAFWRVLHGLQQRFSGATFNSRDLQSAFEAALPRDLWFENRRSLDWFFEGWVNGTAIPRLELAGVKFAPAAGSSVVTGRLLQGGAPAGLVTPVPIYGAQGKSLVFLARVFADGRETRFRVRAPAGVRKLVLDPYQTILRQLK